MGLDFFFLLKKRGGSLASSIVRCKKQGSKNRVWTFFCYSKREEARLSPLFFNNKKKSRPDFLHPVFCTTYLGQYILKVPEP